MPKKIYDNSLNVSLVLKSVVVQIAVTVVAMMIFSIFMFLTEMKYEYSSLLGTLSVGFGLLFSTYYIGKKLKKNGILIGLSTCGITFLIVLLISVIINGFDMTYNTFFHLLIFTLFALIGGIFGVNKSGKNKYI